jgi:hypothetical protein
VTWRRDQQRYGVRSSFVDQVGDVIFMYDHRASGIRVEQSAVEPDLSTIADTLEPEPVLLPRNTADCIELSAVPPVLGGQIRDGLKVGSKENVRIHIVGDKTRHDGGWNRNRIPTGNVVACL